MTHAGPQCQVLTQLSPEANFTTKPPLLAAKVRFKAYSSGAYMANNSSPVMFFVSLVKL